jgi:hypothetical protein
MGKGIIGTVTLLGTVAFAIPVAMLGVQKIGAGNTTLGAAFVGFAILMVLVEEHIMTPGDIPGEIASRTADRVTKTDDSEETAVAEKTDGE